MSKNQIIHELLFSIFKGMSDLLVKRSAETLTWLNQMRAGCRRGKLEHITHLTMNVMTILTTILMTILMISLMFSSVPLFDTSVMDNWLTTKTGIIEAPTWPVRIEQTERGGRWKCSAVAVVWEYFKLASPPDHLFNQSMQSYCFTILRYRTVA